jgi:diaminopimelate dehydrogenase
VSEIGKNPDMTLRAVFTRRNPGDLPDTGVPAVRMGDAAQWRGELDVMLLCGGSANDLPVQGPELARMFSTVDSFDTHAKIPAYLDAMDKAAALGGNLSVISAGWDPGLFSLMRLYTESFLPKGKGYTFWGRGVSQGHSDAVRGVKGVENAVQYTIPSESAMQRIRGGETPELTAREKHTRLCFVAAAEGADRARIEREIKEMPDYFKDYDTEVRFVSASELLDNHAGLPHGGSVIRVGTTGGANTQTAEFSIKLDSNPEFTASVLLATARAAYRLYAQGARGARTLFDIPPALLIPQDPLAAVRELM